MKAARKARGARESCSQAPSALRRARAACVRTRRFPPVTPRGY